MTNFKEFDAIVDSVIACGFYKMGYDNPIPLFMNSKEKNETDTFLKKISKNAIMAVTTPKLTTVDSVHYRGYCFLIIDTGYSE